MATAEKLLQQLLLHTHKVLRKGDDDFFSAFALVRFEIDLEFESSRRRSEKNVS